MATTKTIFNVTASYNLNGTVIPLNISSATITDVTDISVAFNVDGTGEGNDNISGRENPDTISLIMNSVTTALTSTIDSQTRAIIQGKTASQRMGTLTLSMKDDPNDKCILEYARPSGAVLVPNISESSANTYTLELRGRITSNFKGNVD